MPITPPQRLVRHGRVRFAIQIVVANTNQGAEADPKASDFGGDSSDDDGDGQRHCFGSRSTSISHESPGKVHAIEDSVVVHADRSRDAYCTPTSYDIDLALDWGKNTDPKRAVQNTVSGVDFDLSLVPYDDDLDVDRGNDSKHSRADNAAQDAKSDTKVESSGVTDISLPSTVVETEHSKRQAALLACRGLVLVAGDICTRRPGCPLVNGS
ncbi:hypothetical protein LZ30DRAFT_694110 [Colletotrichum cereale]|nr:hypothetical protein LZ30DRAFT_694110 [Colletotrichum cereale]